MVSLLSIIASIIVPKKYFSEGVTQKKFAETEMVRIEGNEFECERKIGNYSKENNIDPGIKHLFG